MDSELIASRIKDALRICNNTSFPRFVGFLRPEEAAQADAVARSQFANYRFFGGYDGAERVFFGAFPDWCQDTEEFFPVKALTFTFRPADSLSHRDFLGTFMALGITRESVGDILIEKGRGVAFFTEELAGFVASQVEKIGGVGVNVASGFTLPLPGMGGFEEITDTVASLRLDCVVAALAGCSRGCAADMIEEGRVALNGICVEKTVKAVQNGDKLTVKGKGKFVIEQTDRRTKKDRIILKAKKYI